MPPGHHDPRTDAFTALIEPHFQRMFRLAWRLTGNRSDAEDLLQDVLIRLYEQRDTLMVVKDLPPWLSRVVYNRFVDLTRARKRRPLKLLGDRDADREGASDAEDPAALTATHQQEDRLQRALARLSDKHRLLVLLHDAEGYTLAEIAAVTSTPLGTLKSRLSRARARLRELLQEDDDRPRPKLGRPRRALRKHKHKELPKQRNEKKVEPFPSGRRADR